MRFCSKQNSGKITKDCAKVQSFFIIKKIKESCKVSEGVGEEKYEKLGNESICDSG